ncbi:MAG: hypothetical protein WCP20_21830 [Desulfuromonadales bacterium]
MTITFKKDRAVFSDMAGGEDAEGLLEWLQKYPNGKMDLSACTHLHPANLQVVMAAKRQITTAPKDKQLAGWIASALKP